MIEIGNISSEHTIHPADIACARTSRTTRFVFSGVEIRFVAQHGCTWSEHTCVRYASKQSTQLKIGSHRGEIKAVLKSNCTEIGPN